MQDDYSNFDFFDNTVIYENNQAQEIYLEIINKGKVFFKDEEFSNIPCDTISELFTELRSFMHEKTNVYSIFSSIKVKIECFDKVINWKKENLFNNSISPQNEYKKILLNALKLMYHINLFYKIKNNSVFKDLLPKYRFLPFLRQIYLDEIYESLINEVDYCIGKLSDLGLDTSIDFENGFILTNGLKYSFLKSNEFRIEFNYKNPFPRIFKNKTCYDLFIWLSENLVKDTYADYSFIYNKMLEGGYIYEIKHKEFVEFLKDFNIEIQYSSFKKSTTTKTKLNKFKEGLDNIKPFSDIF